MVASPFVRAAMSPQAPLRFLTPVLLGALLVAGSVQAADARFVPVTAAQAQALGIQTQRVGAGSKAAAAGLPATVSIPNSQVRVTSPPSLH